MKLKKFELNLIVVMMYLFIILFGNDYIFSFIKNFGNVKNYLVIICPIIFITYFIIKIVREKKVLDFINKNKFLLLTSALLLLSSILSIFFGIVISVTNIKGLINLCIVIGLINIINFIDFTESDAKVIKNHILIIFCLICIYSIFQYIFGWGLSTGGSEKYDIKGRVNSTFYISTLYDKFVLLNIIYILYLILKEEKKIYYPILFLGLLSFALTYSRSSFIILCVIAVLFIIFCILKKKLKQLLVLPLGILLLFGINGYPLVIQSSLNYVYDKVNVPSNFRINFLDMIDNQDSFLFKFYNMQRKIVGLNSMNSNVQDEIDDKNEVINNDADIQGSNENSNNDKIYQIEDINNDKSVNSRKYFESVGEAIISENKLFGIGIGNYYYIYKNQNVNDYLSNKIDVSKFYMYPHNNYIHIAAEIGIPGLILFLILMFIPFIMKYRKNKEYIFLAMSIILLFLLTGISESILHAKHFMYAYSLIFMLMISIDDNKTYKKKMIIYIPKLFYGGMEKSLINFIKYSNYNDEFDLDLHLGYIVNPEMLDLIPKNVNVRLYCKNKWNLMSKIITYVKMQLNYIYNIINNSPYDYSISYAYQHGILAKLARSASNNSSIFIHSDLALSRSQEQIDKMNKKCKYNKFKNIICVSEASKKSFVKCTGINQEKVYTINNFINGEQILRKSKEKVEKKYDFVVVARLDEKSKKISRVLEAGKILKDKGYKFTIGIIGDGDSYDEYNKFIVNNDLGKYLELLGLKRNPYPYIKNAKALIISSDYEGYSLSFLEARILKTYIISTNVSDFKQLLNDNDGIIVEKNANSLSKAMEKIINNTQTNVSQFDYKRFNEIQKNKYDSIFSTQNLKNVMFISSVGGHLTQLLELKKIFKNYNYVLVTENTDVTRDMKDKYNIRYLPYGSRNQKFKYPFVLLWSCVKSFYYFVKYNPDVIVTTGANTAAAMCCFGKLFGKKVIYIESFAKRTSPTVTGKCIYKLHAYTTFVVQWESMLEFYPNAEYWGWIY